MNQTAKTDQGELQKIRAANNYQFIPSTFSFINEHRGFRPGQIHILLGTTGSGKSTVTRQMVIDTAAEFKTLVWLTEETRNDFVVALSKNYPGNDIAQNILIQSEMDIERREPGFFLNVLDNILMAENPGMVFIDNLTTSGFYMGLRPGDQEKIAWRLKKMFEKTEIPCLIVAHTRADVSDTSSRLIEDTDIRGSKTIANLAPYFYIFQRFEIGEKVFPTIRIKKSRMHQVESKLFKLIYSREKNSYTGDMAIDFQAFKEVFKQRNQL